MTEPEIVQTVGGMTRLQRLQEIVSRGDTFFVCAVADDCMELLDRDRAQFAREMDDVIRATLERLRGVTDKELLAERAAQERLESAEDEALYRAAKGF